MCEETADSLPNSEVMENGEMGEKVAAPITSAGICCACSSSSCSVPKVQSCGGLLPVRIFFLVTKELLSWSTRKTAENPELWSPRLDLSNKRDIDW